ncbi:MAG: hypothetical protein V1831_00650, partial [Candidatus Woesearchaeota archaeon]
MKNKKGFPALEVIIAIVIAILIFGVISFVVKNTAHAAEAKTQTETCRLSNAIKAGIEEKSEGWAPGIRLCSTIDKTEGESQVPTKWYEGKYKDDNNEAAAAEIRDMITNCWYMWLEGSKPNMFNQYSNVETCFVCYMFKTRAEVEKVDYDKLKESMNEPYRPADNGGWCTPNGGFLIEGSNECPNKINGIDGGWKKASLNKNGDVCCVREKVTDECLNKGGKCGKGPEEGFSTKYLEWSCPSGEICYVDPDKMESYAQYIAKNDGDLYFISPETVKGYEAGQEYAISFVSPSMQCDVGCQIKYFFTIDL